MTKNPDNYIQCDRNVNCMFVYSNCVSIYHLLLQHGSKSLTLAILYKFGFQIFTPKTSCFI